MQYKFIACGHNNIIGTHKTTLEFTKDKEISLRGDCIIGVNADFDLKKIKNLIKNAINKNIAITIRTISQNKKIKETMHGKINTIFNSNKELVIRKTDFISERTFATNSNKAAFDLNRDLIWFLKEKKNKIFVIIENNE